MKPVTPAYQRKNPGHYSPGMLVGNLLFISGQLSIDPDTGLLPEGGVAAHTKQSLSNLERVLREAGLTRENVAQCRVYVSDVAYWDEVNQAYAEFFGEHRPARVVVPSGDLHNGSLVEIEAIAEVK